jgi:hypothetical protein
MINLIPNEEKKVMYKDFYLRLTTLCFVMLGASVLFAAVSILPSYFLSSTEKNFISGELKLQENDSSATPDQSTLALIKDLKDKLGLVENSEKNKSEFSQKIINGIVLKKIPSIKITGIFYQNDPQTGKRVNINGLAESREVLLLFRKSLEDDAAFSNVDLPVSNFIKGSNIKFNLSLIPS